MRPGKRRALDKSTPMEAILDKVEHPFRVIKRQFGYTKAKYRGLAKNTANLMKLFALSNLWMERSSLFVGVAGMSAPEISQRACQKVEMTLFATKKTTDS